MSTLECTWVKDDEGFKCIRCHHVSTTDKVKQRCRIQQKGLGDHIESGLSAVGITKERWAKLTKKESSSCGGCGSRQGGFNKLGSKIGIGVDPDAPIAKWGNTQYIRTWQLTNSAIMLGRKIPTNIEGIVGIPRSGMIPASVIATHRHLPLYTISNGDLVQADNGYRSRHLNGGSRLAFIDDTIHEGNQIPRIKERFPGHWYGVVFSTERASHLVDAYEYILESPHLLEWNWANAPFSVVCGSDLDGVICCEKTGQCLQRPNNDPLKAVITARHESVRQLTVEWLRHHGVRYRELVMADFDHRQKNPHEIGKWKSEQCSRRKVEIFYESNPHQVAAFNHHSKWTLGIHAGY